MKLIHSIIALALTAAGLQACDNVSEGDRFEGPVTVEAKKNVLIEDFTGQRCVNCPYAAQKIVDLQEHYGAERVIAVSIHGGGLAYNEDTTPIGLANAQGREYHTHWGVKSWPKGLIDRQGGLIDFEQWDAAVVNRFAVEPQVALSISDLHYDEATHQLSLTTHVSSELGAEGRLQVWLTESNLVRKQLTPEQGYVNDYVHNHVFRASVNDPYGDAMTLAAGQSEDKSYTYTLQTEASGKGPGWIPANMAVVVFFYNDANGVMQVIDQPLNAH